MLNFSFCQIILKKTSPINSKQLRRIEQKEDLLDFRAFYPFSELLTQIVTGIICDDIDVFSLGVPLQSRPVKRDGRIGIDARTLMGYDVCYIMRIKHSVDVDLGPNRSRWAALNVYPS